MHEGNINSLDQELLANLKLIHHDNPAERKATKFLKYIMHADQLLYIEFRLMMEAIQEEALVSNELAARLHVAVLTWMARSAGG